MRQGGTSSTSTNKLDVRVANHRHHPKGVLNSSTPIYLLSSCFVLQAEGNDKRIDEDEDHNDIQDREGPKVTIHSSHGTFDTKEDGSATAYIINGPETNVAAGSGLRGIRWLRGP